jgi:hypothetical protein
MKVKRANRLMSIIDEIWVDTSTKSQYLINDWYLGQIFSLYTCNYGFIYLYLYTVQYAQCAFQQQITLVRRR